MKRISSYILLTLAAWIACPAQPVETPVFAQSQWITCQQAGDEPNQWICFRHDIDVTDPQASAVINISVDSKYWLWVNKDLVVYEGQLKRGPNPTDTYYDSVDLGSHLRQGKNQISILVWYWGKDGFCHKSSGKPGLLVDFVINGQTALKSDATWRTLVHPAYGDTEAPFPNFRLPESNVRYDARQSLGDWQSAEYDDNAWPRATECGAYPCQPWNAVHPRPIPNWDFSEIVKYESVQREDGDTCRIIARLPKNITVSPYIKVNAPAGRTIDMRSDNYKGGSEYNVRSEYVTADGVQQYEAYNYFNGHNVIYTFPRDVEVLEIGYRESKYNVKHTGSFVCNDTFFNTLREKALNTLNLNMRDAIQDADRERSQWWGDVVIISGEIYYACDANGIKAVKKAIDNLIDWQKIDGVLFSPIPSGKWDGELPAQMLASIGKYGLWNYYLCTADTATISHAYPAVKKYMTLWQIDNDGLVAHRAGDWDWSDWGNGIDSRLLDNAWYSLALEGVANMASLLGDAEYSSVCRKQMQDIKSNVNRLMWRDGVYASDGFESKPDDRGNALAALAGFADDEKWQSIRSFLTTHFSASPYMEKYVLESLFEREEPVAALQRMKTRYREMVESPLTTLWEDWSIGGSGGGSINHGWAGGPLTLMSQYVAGVSATSPGFRTFDVKPQLGDLEEVQATVPTAYGNIEVSVQKKPAFEMTLTVPGGCDATVTLPSEMGKVILNGKTIRLNHSADGKHALLELPSGNYHITHHSEQLAIKE